MRFLIDENLPAWLAGDLRAGGLDAEDVREIGRCGLMDDEVYRLALRAHRHIVSANYKDFGNPLLFPPTKQVGIVIIRMPKCTVRALSALVAAFLGAAKPNEIAGCLVVLEPNRSRRRRVA